MLMNNTHDKNRSCADSLHIKLSSILLFVNLQTCVRDRCRVGMVLNVDVVEYPVVVLAGTHGAAESRH